MKNKTYDGMLAALCVFLFLTFGCGVTALCLLQNNTILLGFPLKYCFAALCGAFLVVYLALMFASIGQKRAKRIGLSFVIVFAGGILIALSPIAFIMWIIQTIVEAIAEKKTTKQP